MALGMVTGLNHEICVQDIGLTGLTHADGLAVGRPSGFVGSVMKPMLSGEFTVRDAGLYDYMRELLATEDIFLEPSACAAFQGPVRLNQSEEMRKYLAENNLTEKWSGQPILYGQPEEVWCRRRFGKNINEFGLFRSQAGFNAFTVSPSK